MAVISAGAWSMAEIPRASQAQLAHHSPLGVVTRKEVGTAEKGMAIQRPRVAGSSTRTWAAA
ncbi:MAG: hypothetical protein ABIZ96_04490, partial [Gemmatimonadales bacterium]